MKLDDFKTISLRVGKPQKNMTDEYWQQYFNVMRVLITPSQQRKLQAVQSYSNADRENGKEYQGETLYVSYCCFINSILDTIRRVGEHDCCFFIYQVADLLRFEPNRLRTKWNTEYEYFDVWLENSLF